MSSTASARRSDVSLDTLFGLIGESQWSGSIADQLQEKRRSRWAKTEGSDFGLSFLLNSRWQRPAFKRINLSSGSTPMSLFLGAKDCPANRGFLLP